ncbi:DUF6232 family protein [Streptomyces sp. NPDC094448]|uniref:DUF6232 family protein n=1 Tax=Streptomyces sp. NPDC094448 TaxID=3366063 RepID=UPI003809940F
MSQPDPAPDPPPQQPWRNPPRPPAGSPPAPRHPPAPGLPPDPAGPERFPADGAYRTVGIRVTQRLLWVDQAVYPLQNITRVHTTMLAPDRKRAVLTLVKVLVVLVPVFIIIGLLEEATAPSGGYGSDEPSGASALLTTIWVLAVLGTIALVIRTLVIVLSPSRDVLVIETSGPPAAVLPGRDRAELHRITLRIAHALEHPETEFQLTVQTLVMGNMRNYQYNNNVNMFGGNGNTGVSG